MGLRFLTAGESHGPGLIAILEVLPAGLALSAEVIDRQLARRQRGYGAGPRMKIEHDTVKILGGVMEGATTGAPLALLIQYRDHERWRGCQVPPFTMPRPGHADLTGTLKYGYKDLRPALERASARETAARVAVGAVCQHLLDQFDIQIGGYVLAIGPVLADVSQIPLQDRFALAEESEVRCPDGKASQQMMEAIRLTMQNRDTAGGIIEVIVLGLPAGLGSHVHWDRRLSTRLGAAVMSIQAIKGVEIGPAFENARLPGTQAQDPIRLNGEEIVRATTRNGGLEGGITTGQPLVVRAALKPIATTLSPQQTVDLARGEEVPTQYERSDFCPVPRAVVIVESMIAFVLAEALLEKVGGDSLEEIRPRFETLRRTRLPDLPMETVRSCSGRMRRSEQNMTTSVLLVTDAIRHPPLLGRYRLWKGLAAIPGYRFLRVTSLESLPKLALDATKGMVLYFHHKRISATALDRLEDFVRNGGGLLAVHSASASFKLEPRYFRIIGGRFLHHDPIHSFVVEALSQEDEIFGAIPSFSVKDELYRHEIEPGNCIHFVSKAGGEAVPIVWTRTYGDGRVCYCSLGHRSDVPGNPAVLQILRLGLAWCCSPMLEAEDHGQ